MVILVLGVIISVILLIALLIIASRRGKKKSIAALALIPLVAGMIAGCISFVPTGYTGIITTFGRVEQRTLTAGAHFIMPWQQIVKMDNRTQKVVVDTVAFSSDIQQVNVQMSVNYAIDQPTAQNLYKTVGQLYYDQVVYPRVLENTKATFAGYTADSLVANRSELSIRVGESLSKDMMPYGITIISVSIENIDFTDAFTDAVEAKQVAEQNKLRAQTEQEQLTMEQQQQAERQLIAAEAAAEVRRINADAELYEAEQKAEANKKLSETLTPELIEYITAQHWDGKLPIFIGGGETMPILDMSNFVDDGSTGVVPVE